MQTVKGRTTQVIGFRVSVDEFNILSGLADKLGITVSEYVKRRVEQHVVAAKGGIHTVNKVVNTMRYEPPKVGDTVFVRGKAVVIPEIDAEGRIVPDYGF